MQKVKHLRENQKSRHKALITGFNFLSNKKVGGRSAGSVLKQCLIHDCNQSYSKSCQTHLHRPVVHLHVPFKVHEGGRVVGAEWFFHLLCLLVKKKCSCTALYSQLFPSFPYSFLQACSLTTQYLKKLPYPKFTPFQSRIRITG